MPASVNAAPVVPTVFLLLPGSFFLLWHLFLPPQAQQAVCRVKEAGMTFYRHDLCSRMVLYAPSATCSPCATHLFDDPTTLSGKPRRVDGVGMGSRGGSS